MMKHSDFNEETLGKASLHVSLAVIGLLAIIALAGWSAYNKNFAANGLACRDQGSQMTLTGCVDQPKRLPANR